LIEVKIKCSFREEDTAHGKDENKEAPGECIPGASLLKQLLL
jgi:hypothetical protein